MNYYTIKLTPEQSVNLYGFLKAKRTLNWMDIVKQQTITFKVCVDTGMEIKKLHKIQPELKEWIKYDKVFIHDIPFLEPWNPNPFEDFKCSIGDIIVHRKYITPDILKKCHINFKTLNEKYGVDESNMILFRYSLNDWINLGLTESFVMKENFDENQWKDIFGTNSKQEVITMIKRNNLSFLV